uniref:Phosphorylase b kinase regulatory subunit n=1 Tax=Echinococcus granulosus TaxID=6210 RepID=A0A068WUP0_ECHGR|nr:phosphorylase b kinase regulatory [Echinococcus granulosus]
MQAHTPLLQKVNLEAKVTFTTGIWYKNAETLVKPEKSSGGYVGTYPLIYEEMYQAHTLYYSCLNNNFRTSPVLTASSLFLIVGSVVYAFAGPLVILSRSAFYHCAMVGSMLLAFFVLLNLAACNFLFDCLRRSQAMQIDDHGNYVENMQGNNIFDVRTRMEEATTAKVATYLTVLGFLPIVIMGSLAEKILGYRVTLGRTPSLFILMGIDKNKLDYYYGLISETILSLQCVVNLMRGILKCYMYQADKVESFKKTQCASSSLHAKFDSRTCKAVVGDYEWGHLQIDAVSLYLLALAQMTASGLRIIWTVDEVAFIQNLVFYIEPASRIPDYGIWERGDKTNHGLPELNTSSVGLAKAALESLNGLDLFGPQGGANSTIHCLMDECQKCNTVLENMLPRESYSKETDAALLGIISYPGFAVTDEALIERTRNTVLSKLLGSYGCIRFLRDGYKTAREDPSRLHYEPWELRMFDGIECQWPLFFTYLVIGACFNDKFDLAKKYMDQLDQIVLHRKIPHDRHDDPVIQLTTRKPATDTDDALYPIMPELYSLPGEKIDAELKAHNSQVRIPIGSAPHLWGQSMYILSRLIMDRLLLPGEIDPLGRRMASEPKPDLVVQIVVLAEDDLVKERLAEFNLDVQTPSEVVCDSGIQIYSAKVLLQIYNQLGGCPKLGLSGRTARDLGVIATSSLYRIGNTTMAFTPQFIDSHSFYVNLDVNFTLDEFRSNVAFLRRVWAYPGRPTLLLPVAERFVRPESDSLLPSVVTVIKKLKSGYINGTRVALGNISQFEATSCVQKLSFIKSAETVMKRHSVLRSGSLRHRRLTLASPHSRGVEFSSPTCLGDQQSTYSSLASTPTGASGLISPGGTHLLSDGRMRDEHEGMQRTSLRRKSLALACAVSVDLAIADDDSREMSRRRGFYFATPYYGSKCEDEEAGEVGNREVHHHHRYPSPFSVYCRGESSSLCSSRSYSCSTTPNRTPQPSGPPPCCNHRRSRPRFLRSRSTSVDALGPKEISFDEKGYLTGLHDHDPTLTERKQTDEEMTLQRLRVGELPNFSDSSYETAFRRIIMCPKDNAAGDGDGGGLQRPTNLRFSTRTSQSRKTSSGRSSQSGGSAGSTGADVSCEWLANLNAEQMVEYLQQTGNLAKQAEILGRLKQMKGLDWDTGMDSETPATVRSLLKEVYQKACQLQDWFLLRYIGGLLEKIADQLATAVSSILILQKQITVGLPPKPREKVISSPLPPAQIAQLIQEACGEDNLMAMLTQELLLHLSMFARSHPKLLANVLCLRTGLIIKLMGTELARSMESSVEDALLALFYMSPYETNCLLANLLSGNEIRAVKIGNQITLASASSRRKSSALLKVDSPYDLSYLTSPTMSIPQSPTSTLRSAGGTRARAGSLAVTSVEPPGEVRDLWSRRRKIDGALNRVPPQFFQCTYTILERLQGLRIGENTLTTSLTKELVVESFINTVPTPEYRQLLVEATTVLGALVTHDEDARIQLNCIVSLDDLVAKANRIFLEDQAAHGANATVCCANHLVRASRSASGGTKGENSELSTTPTESNPSGVTRKMGVVGGGQVPPIPVPPQQKCRGSHHICHFFYDTPPAGRFGTMAYMVRALSVIIGDSLPLGNSGNIAINCSVA